jgi:hypothetical protein
MPVLPLSNIDDAKKVHLRIFSKDNMFTPDYECQLTPGWGEKDRVIV